MPDLSILKTPAPYHILAYGLPPPHFSYASNMNSYGTLLGSSVFQSFIGGVVAYRALPRPQFSSLQQKIFPIYFSMQTALPAVLALTYPGSKLFGTANSLPGTFTESNRWSVLAPILTIFTTSLLNMVVVGPATTNIMKERKHQGMLFSLVNI